MQRNKKKKKCMIYPKFEQQLDHLTINQEILTCGIFVLRDMTVTTPGYSMNMKLF